MKGIILAGGKGTRLHPVTRGISKQLLPVYNKPMIYYPLSTLMLAGIREILVITTQEDQENYFRVLGMGEKLGMRIVYGIQEKPKGLADAFIVGRHFLRDEQNCALILGDNVFFGHDLPLKIKNAANHIEKTGGAVIFGYPVKDPERYGIVEVDKDGTALSIEEKPKAPKSKLAVPGLYFYDREVVEIAESLKPSPRGEIEITDVNKRYLEKGKLLVSRFGRGTAWLDAGTHESLLQASNFIAAIESRQGLMVGCIEEISFRNGWVDRQELLELATAYGDTPYGDYLRNLDA